MPKGSLVVLSSPSGGGKTTLAKDIVARNANIERAISYTTRARRENETADKDYYFISDEEFLAKEQNGDFLESAMVFGNQYGTCAAWVQNKLASGIDIICTIDCQGAKQIKEKFPEAILIFIMPPSKQVLVNRLQRRAADSEQDMITRLSAAKAEVMQYEVFDYIVINDNFDKASKQIAAVIKGDGATVHVQQENIKSILNSFA